MAALDSDAARALFKSNENSEKLADIIEAAAPLCECEAISVGEGSPGPVMNEEFVHRILASPRDYDPVTNRVNERTFHKVFRNGLSVWRRKGPPSDIQALMEEALRSKPSDQTKILYGVLEASIQDVRNLTDSDGSRCFCVYDQTVDRIDRQLRPVPTHASILQRSPAPKTPNRNLLQRDLAGELRKLFERNFIEADAYADDLCRDLNRRSHDGEFCK